MTTPSTTIYARIPTELKTEVDSVAARWKMTLAKTVAILLRVGIEHAELVCPLCGHLKETE